MRQLIKKQVFVMLFFNFYLIISNERDIFMNDAFVRKEEVSYYNNESRIKLSATLTLPARKEPFPAIVLVAGYGKHDRDLTNNELKHFKVLAEYLTSRGFAVLRYDKRGVGTSEGNWAEVNTEALAQDACAAVDYLKTRSDINAQSIGMIGLSEGGLITAMVAAQSHSLAYAILLAPFIGCGIKNMVDQVGLQLLADGGSSAFIDSDKIIRTAVYNVAQKESNSASAQQKIRDLISEYVFSLSDEQKTEAAKLPFAFSESKIEMWAQVLTSPAYQFYFKYDATEILKSIKIPVLALAGDCDFIASPSKIFPLLKEAFDAASKKNYSLLELKKINHTFQRCQTGAIMEYGMIKESIDQEVLAAIGDWITQQLQ